MNIHIDSEVICKGESCGSVTCLIVDPGSEELTHIVVTESNFPRPSKKRLVPIEHVSEADEEKVVLDISHQELLEMRDFIEHEFVPGGTRHGYGSKHLRKPFSLMRPVDRERVPSGETAIHSGADVYAEGEVIGKVDDLLIKSTDDPEITHIVMREGHLWAKKHITVPVSDIAEIKPDSIHLKITKEEIDSLPTVKVKGWFG